MSNNIGLPSNTHPVLNPDGTMNRVWYLYLSQLSGAASAPSVSSVAAETRPPHQAEEDTIEGGTQHVPPNHPEHSTEHHTEPTQNVGNVMALVEQVLQFHSLIP